MAAIFILDISRLVYTARCQTPAGIPRVELAYAEHFIASVPHRIRFAVRDALGRIRLVENHRAIEIVHGLRRFWQHDTASDSASRRLARSAVRLHVRLLLSPAGSLGGLVRRHPGRCVYILTSQLHLEEPDTIVKLKNQHALKVLYFVHDILPIRFPEYFPAGSTGDYRSRLESAARVADIVVTNSQATAHGFSQTFCASRPDLKIAVAPLGVDKHIDPVNRIADGTAPYFVMIGTIEPRKNHLLILQLWRSLHAQLGADTPRLILIGSRGWENENTIDLLDRSIALRGVVEERNRLSDNDVRQVLSGACALLMPSFAEGFGLPLAEALAAGVPALCSDIPVFHEVGGLVPEFIDPNNGAAWRGAILDYLDPQSLRRAAQLARLETHEPTRWAQHFGTVDALIETLASAA